MKALIVEQPRKAYFKEVATPIPGEEDILIRVKCAGICGTDNAIYTGECSFVKDGSIKYPVRIGHEWSGVVEAVGSKVTGFKKGDRVIADNAVSCGQCPDCKDGRLADCAFIRSVGTVNCWDGCFAEYMLMPQYHVYHLEDIISFEEAALIEPVSIAYESFKEMSLNQNSSVVVIGTGPIGMASVALARYYGAGQVIMVGRKDNKLALAAELGATDLINNTREDAVAKIWELTGNKGAQLLLETSGAQQGLVTAMKGASKLGIVSVIGFYEKNIDDIPIDHLVLNEITLKGAAGCYGNAEAVKNIMAQGNLALKPLITHRIKFEDCLEMFENADKYSKEKIKVMVYFDSE